MNIIWNPEKIDPLRLLEIGTLLNSMVVIAVVPQAKNSLHQHRTLIIPRNWFKQLESWANGLCRCNTDLSWAWGQRSVLICSTNWISKLGPVFMECVLIIRKKNGKFWHQTIRLGVIEVHLYVLLNETIFYVLLNGKFYVLLNGIIFSMITNWSLLSPTTLIWSQATVKPDSRRWCHVALEYRSHEVHTS